MSEELFTAQIDEDLLFERDEHDTSWIALQKRFGIPVATLKKRYRALIDAEIAAERAKYAGETKCLGSYCGKKFMSEDKFRIRFCDSCRNKNKELAVNMAEDSYVA